jgi:hypothetical protein
MDDSPPWRVYAEFYDPDRYEQVYDQYKDLDVGWKEVIEAGTDALSDGSDELFINTSETVADTGQE